MALEVDPEMPVALGDPTAAVAGPPVGDVETRRQGMAAAMARVAAGGHRLPVLIGPTT